MAKKRYYKKVKWRRFPAVQHAVGIRCPDCGVTMKSCLHTLRCSYCDTVYKLKGHKLVQTADNKQRRADVLRAAKAHPTIIDLDLIR